MALFFVIAGVACGTVYVILDIVIAWAIVRDAWRGRDETIGQICKSFFIALFFGFPIYAYFVMTTWVIRYYMAESRVAAEWNERHE